MIDWKQDLAILSDLSANIFAVFILVLIILLQQPPQTEPTDQRSRPPAIVEAMTDLTTIERAPMPAASTIAQLYDRRRSADGLSIDLFENRVVVTGSSEEFQFRAARAARSDETITQGIERAVRSSPATASVRLYVFSNRHYGVVADVLTRSGRSWRELSVPAALRGGSGESAGDAWSDAFSQLILRPLDLSRFRFALARLLAGSGEGPAALAGGERPSGGSQDPPSVIGRLTKLGGYLGTIFAIVMIVTAIVAVLLIEWRLPRSRYLLRRGKS